MRVDSEKEETIMARVRVARSPLRAITLILLIEETRRRDAFVEEDAAEEQSDTQRVGSTVSSVPA